MSNAPSPLTASKRDRLHLRLDAEAKRVLERAAGYQATSVSDFVLANAVQAAEAVIRSHESVVLAPADWAVFHAALHDPPAPNAALRAAAARYRDRAGG